MFISGWAREVVSPCGIYWISLYIYWFSGILIDSWPFNLLRGLNFAERNFLRTQKMLFSSLA